MDSIILHEFYSVFIWYLSKLLLSFLYSLFKNLPVFLHIDLISNQNKNCAWVNFFSNTFFPFFEVFKWWASNIIFNKNFSPSTLTYWHYIQKRHLENLYRMISRYSKKILVQPRILNINHHQENYCVPDLELNLCWFIYFHKLWTKFCTNCNVIVFLESVVNISLKNWCFSNTWLW